MPVGRNANPGPNKLCLALGHDALMKVNIVHLHCYDDEC